MITVYSAFPGTPTQMPERRHINMDWFRSHHGAPSDPKLAVVAKHAKTSRGNAVALWWLLLDFASQNKPRGSVEGLDVETAAFTLEIDEGVCTALLEAFTAKGMILDDAITTWHKRQPKKEDDSTERVRRKRNKDKLTQGNGDVTPGNDSATTERERDRKIDTPLPPNEDEDDITNNGDRDSGALENTNQAPAGGNEQTPGIGSENDGTSFQEDVGNTESQQPAVAQPEQLDQVWNKELGQWSIPSPAEQLAKQRAAEAVPPNLLLDRERIIGTVMAFHISRANAEMYVNGAKDYMQRQELVDLIQHCKIKGFTREQFHEHLTDTVNKLERKAKATMHGDIGRENLQIWGRVSNRLRGEKGESYWSSIIKPVCVDSVNANSLTLRAPRAMVVELRDGLAARIAELWGKETEQTMAIRIEEQ